MAAPKRLKCLMIVFLGFGIGCAATIVHKNPGPLDRGVRFYRPKPYLFIQPFGESESVRKEETDKKIVTTTSSVGKPSDKFVSMKLEWLPDFSEEYSIYARAGIGKNDTSFKLENGWNLTELNMKLDTRLPENIEALAKLTEAIPKGMAGLAAGGSRVETTGAVVVAATNVPLGYYEAVISKEKHGKKRLYGWRYVGFMPYANCPIESSGVDCQPCDGLPLYGLGFENGVMTFRVLEQMKINGAELQAQTMSTAPSINSVAAAVLAEQKIVAGMYLIEAGMKGDVLHVEITLKKTAVLLDQADLNKKLTAQLQSGLKLISPPVVIIK